MLTVTYKLTNTQAHLLLGSCTYEYTDELLSETALQTYTSVLPLVIHDMPPSRPIPGSNDLATWGVHTCRRKQLTERYGVASAYYTR